jgi:hypothetical protein
MDKLKYMDKDMLKKAREQFTKEDRRGSAGRESAEKNRMEKRVLRERGGVQGSVEVVPNAEMRMPSRKQMITEGMMDLANKPSADFGKEMAREKLKQQKQFEDWDKYKNRR